MQLPIDDTEETICQALRSLQPGGRMVLSAPTGSGKSTRVPVWCHRHGLGPVLVIEPRRVACRALAGWVARGLGQAVGEEVGFSVRFEQRASADTAILFVTPGVARRLLLEESLGAYATIIFDEFHERSWETDTVMALLAAQSGGPRLLLMSATLEAERLARTYSAVRTESPGRSYPVEIAYRSDPRQKAPSSGQLTERVVAAIEAEWNAEASMLVFLPGLAAMQEVRQRLSKLPVRLLHGSFGNAQHDTVFSEESPRIVLATNVAESSLTVPGITTVIDAGLEKRAVHQSGYVALSTVAISAASAEQRAGRAGRTAPGRCLRLWDESARLEASRPADLERMELDELLLFLAGLPDGLSTPAHWLDPPPRFAWERALTRLQAKQLVDDEGRVTALGRAAARLPVEADWARILLLAPQELAADLCDLYALSASRRGLTLGGASSEQVEQRQHDLGEEPWRYALSLLRRGDPALHGLDREALQEARRLSEDLRRSVAAVDTDQGLPHPQLGMFLAQHWPERHFVRRQKRDAWANGEIECRLARQETLPQECSAAVILQIDPVASHGLKVELRGRLALPVRLSLLRQAGFGSPELSKIRFRDGKLTAKIEQMFAGRSLGHTEEELSGAPFRQALVELVSEGRWKPELWEPWQEHAFYAELQAALFAEPSGGKDGDPQRFDPGKLLLEKLTELGLESSEDLELLEPQEYLPEPACDPDKKKSYPRHYSYGGVAYDVSYLPQRSLVRLCWRSGPKGARPNPTQLPRWNGWRVEVDERGRITPLR